MRDKSQVFSDKALSKLVLNAPESFDFKASDGVNVEGWVIRPNGFRGKRAPTVVEIHGGPRTAYGHCFMFEFQLLAASGIAVLFTNPRGSAAYGEEFAAARSPRTMEIEITKTSWNQWII